MIHEHLGRLWARIGLLKRLLLLTIALNVVTVSAGGITSYLLYTGAFELSENLYEQIERNKELDAFQEKLRQLPPPDAVLSLSPSKLFDFARDWGALHKEAVDLRLVTAMAPLHIKAYPDWHESVQKKWETLRRTPPLDPKNLAQRERRLSQGLIWLGALSLVFGILLPCLIFYLLSLALKKAHSEVRNLSKKLLGEWHETLGRYDKGAFQNPSFWFEVGLIFVEKLEHYSRHPGVLLSSELAQVVRREWRQSAPKASVEAHKDNKAA